MNGENFNLFFTLVKLKFYIVSMMDSPSAVKTFYLTEEFLERRIPEHKSEVIEALKNYGINSDSEIAFDDSVILKFKELAREKENHVELSAILDKLDIASRGLSGTGPGEYRSEREKLANKILENLFQLSSDWVIHKELENKFDDYSVLDEEDVIRPEESDKLDVLNSNTTASFKTLTRLTTNYIALLSDYYFKYGGDLQLKEFWQDLEIIQKKIINKYIELFKSYGFDGPF